MVVAHQVSDKTFSLKRLDQSFTMTGDHWSAMATCPKHPEHQTSIVVTDGKVDASELRYKEDGDDAGKDGNGDPKGDE
jgi:hypothetical protein